MEASPILDWFGPTGFTSTVFIIIVRSIKSRNKEPVRTVSYTHLHHHPHEHRGLKEILHIISHAQITDRAKEIANRIFQILAEAESAAHGVPAEEVHFHEVGAVDSIVDIVAAAVCLDNLDIDQVIVPKLCEGSGLSLIHI